eukprot:Phypoly_transcript_05865.p1 GENE.Phypoly_transcript_05865~~Phypoly_transcript_05865.p1  ORF type:complete len:458 (+),score=83.53 Phypoly_transcript_05865:461-1834(+)
MAENWVTSTQIVKQVITDIVDFIKKNVGLLQAELHEVEAELTSASGDMDGGFFSGTDTDIEWSALEISVVVVGGVLALVTSPVWIPLTLIGFAIKKIVQAGKESIYISNAKKEKKAWLTKRAKAFMEEKFAILTLKFMEAKLQAPDTLNQNFKNFIEAKAKACEEMLDFPDRPYKNVGPYYQHLYKELLQVHEEYAKFFLFRLKEHTINFADVRIIQRIGGGAFGDVYSGEYRGIPVAIKRMKEVSFQSFVQEESQLLKIAHPNVIKYYGSFLDGNKEPFLVMELAQSSLDTQMVTAPLARRIAWAIDVARGLQCIQQTGSVHRDVKPENVLIVGETAKITDFGLTKEELDITNTFCGSPAYMAPEIFKRVKYNHTVDTYAFGLLLWQILHPTVFPFPSVQSIPELAVAIINGLRPTISSAFKGPMAEVITSCWHGDPKLRPEWSEVISKLQAVKLK